LADGLIDTVWQIDQELEAGALAVQLGGGGERKELDLVKEGRKRLAGLLKSLVVSFTLSNYHCPEIRD